jgi:hypothetical protein
MLYHQVDTIMVLETLLVTTVPCLFHQEVLHGNWAYTEKAKVANQCGGHCCKERGKH